MTSRMIVITGVGRGLGRAMVEEFLNLGHYVVGCSRNPEHVDALKVRYCPGPRFDVVDVTDDEAVRRWSNEVVEGWTSGGRSPDRPPDLLINNAAVVNRNAPLWEVPPDEFSRVIDVNIKGIYNVLRHFLPLMVA